MWANWASAMSKWSSTAEIRTPVLRITAAAALGSPVLSRFSRRRLCKLSILFQPDLPSSVKSLTVEKSSEIAAPIVVRIALSSETYLVLSWGDVSSSSCAQVLKALG